MSTEASILLAFGVIVVGLLGAFAIALSVVAKAAEEAARDLAGRWQARDLPKIEASRPFHVETAEGEVEVWER